MAFIVSSFKTCGLQDWAGGRMAEEEICSEENQATQPVESGEVRMLSDAVLKDLHELALKRVDAAIGTVSQLLDNDEQIVHLIMFILSALARETATHIHETAQKKDGSLVPKSEAFNTIMKILMQTRI